VISLTIAIAFQPKLLNVNVLPLSMRDQSTLLIQKAKKLRWKSPDAAQLWKALFCT
jgi:hypothetical protein